MENGGERAIAYASRSLKTVKMSLATETLTKEYLKQLF
jgi:hypothetical protein